MALREPQQRFRNAFQNAPIGMALVGLDGRFLDVNGALSQLLGFAPDQLSVITVQEVTHPLDVEALRAGTQQLLAGEIARFQAEQRYLHANGHAGWSRVSVSLMREPNGRPLYYVLGIDDITAQKTERLRAIPVAVTRMLVEAPTLEAASEFCGGSARSLAGRSVSSGSGIPTMSSACEISGMPRRQKAAPSRPTP